LGCVFAHRSFFAGTGGQSAGSAVDIERKRIVQHIAQAPVAMDCSADVDDRENAFSASSDSTLPAQAANPAWMKMW
jgi:hypothetical protein